MKPLATHKTEQNRTAIDPWTAVYLSSGPALGLMGGGMARALGQQWEATALRLPAL